MTEPGYRKLVKRLLIGALALTVGFPVLVLLHNLSDLLGTMVGDVAVLKGLLDLLSVVAFFAALLSGESGRVPGRGPPRAAHPRALALDASDASRSGARNGSGLGHDTPLGEPLEHHRARPGCGLQREFRGGALGTARELEGVPPWPWPGKGRAGLRLRRGDQTARIH